MQPLVLKMFYFFTFFFFFNSSRMITEMTWESPGFPMELKLFVG